MHVGGAVLSSWGRLTIVVQKDCYPLSLGELLELGKVLQQTRMLCLWEPTSK